MTEDGGLVACCCCRRRLFSSAAGNNFHWAGQWVNPETPFNAVWIPKTSSEPAIHHLQNSSNRFASSESDSEISDFNCSDSRAGLQLIVAKHQAGRDPAQSRIPMDAAEVDWAETFPQRNCRVRAVGSSCPMAAPGASIKSQPSHILFPPMPCLQDPWFFCFPRFPQAHDSHNNHPRGGRSKKICYAPESFSFNFANRINNNGRQILWHAFAFRIRLELMLEPKRPLEPDPAQPAPDVCEVGKSAIPPSIPAHPSFAQVSPDRRVFLAARDGSHSGHGNPIMGANLACP